MAEHRPDAPADAWIERRPYSVDQQVEDDDDAEEKSTTPMTMV
ncbi:MAG: hypothetical protein R3E89_16395 [Thiolinea sp.]